MPEPFRLPQEQSLCHRTASQIRQPTGIKHIVPVEARRVLEQLANSPGLNRPGRPRETLSLGTLELQHSLKACNNAAHGITHRGFSAVRGKWNSKSRGADGHRPCPHSFVRTVLFLEDTADTFIPLIGSGPTGVNSDKVRFRPECLRENIRSPFPADAQGTHGTGFISIVRLLSQ
jgi:hypothetical protein